MSDYLIVWGDWMSGGRNQLETLLSADAEQRIARWRAEADADHPAGPLYTGGEFAESDMMADDVAFSPIPHCPLCTQDSSSKIGQCCC
jgi:hypothetical protein